MKKNYLDVFSQIKLINCMDGYEFRRSADCQEWLKRLLAYVQVKAIPCADVRIYPYCHGAGTYLAVDVDPHNPNNEACVIITIFLSGDRITLDAPTDGQLDIELPGIIDALWLASSISKTLGNPAETPSVKLWCGSRSVN